MARGHADFTRGFGYREVVTRQSLLFDTGKALLVDNFDEPNLDWSVTGTVGGSVVLNTTVIFSGAGSAKVTTKAETSAAYGIIKNVSMPASNKAGLECVVRPIGPNLEYFTMKIEAISSGTLYEFAVRWDRVNQKWQFLNSSDAWADIPGAAHNLDVSQLVWHRFKLMVDSGTHKYLKLFVDNKVFDLIGLSVRSTSAVLGDLMQVSIRASPSSATAGVYYIDNVAITEED